MGVTTSFLPRMEFPTWSECSYVGFPTCSHNHAIIQACQFNANTRLSHISHVAAFFAYFSKVRLLHIFFDINWHFPQQV